MASWRQAPIRAMRGVGAWLLPALPDATSASAAASLHLRAGIAGTLAIVTGVAVTVTAAAWALIMPLAGPADEDVLTVVVGAILILGLAILVPAATFRTSNSAWTRTLLTDNDTRIRSWQRVTIRFDPLLVGALLAGIITPPALTIALIGVALIARAVFAAHRDGDHNNSRFYELFSSFSTGVTAIIAYAIVFTLAPLVVNELSIWPLLLAVLIALYSGLALNGLERWATRQSDRWAFLRDAIDVRRLLIAGITAVVAWLAFAVAVVVADALPRWGDEIGGLAGVGVLLVAWGLLWLASIAWWRHDARVLLAAWRSHQAEIMRRLADGSLSPELAARAALPTVTRVALSTFGATRALGVMELPDGTRRSALAGLDLNDVGATPRPSDLLAHPHREIRLGRPDREQGDGWVTISSWLAPGAFLIRSRDIVDEFTDLATVTLLAPVTAQDYLSTGRAFELMFDDRSSWPTMAAFAEACARLRTRADQSTQSTSMLIGVLEIDEFGALAGGKFEQAAVAQVIRTVVGNPDFAGEEVFVSYGEAGRIWIALLGGPVVRQGIAQLRALQQWLNDHGSVSSARVDVEVSVSVSLGYAAYQVDAVSVPEIMSVASDRLDRDKSARRALLGDSLGYLDFTPEDITGSATPVSTADLAQALADHEDDRSGLDVSVRTLVTPRHRETAGLMLEVSWGDAPGDLDLSTPERLLDAAEHRIDLAVEYAAGSIAAMRDLMASTADTTLPVLAHAPALLLHPDSGAAALPNIAGRMLDRVEAARAIFIISAIPRGAGQAAQLLEDRGVRLAVMADAAMGADPDDLLGWSPWAIVFPLDSSRRPTGLDALAVQQVTSALARRGTILVAEAGSSSQVDPLGRAGFTLVALPSAPIDIAEASVALPISDAN